jgi:hypothetical protein
MPVTKKPRAASQAQTKSALAEAEIQALIEKGGSIAKAEGKAITTSKPQLVQLRLTRDVIARIDVIREARLVKIPRHMWLLEAIHEKLVREEENVEKEL